MISQLARRPNFDYLLALEPKKQPRNPSRTSPSWVLVQIQLSGMEKDVSITGLCSDMYKVKFQAHSWWLVALKSNLSCCLTTSRAFYACFPLRAWSARAEFLPGSRCAKATSTEQAGRWHRAHTVAIGHHWCKALGQSSPQRQPQDQGLLELIQPKKPTELGRCFLRMVARQASPDNQYPLPGYCPAYVPSLFAT